MVPEKVSVVPEPMSTVVVPAMVGAGRPLTVSAVDVTLELPQLLVAVSVYTPADAVFTENAAGVAPVTVNPPGPLHE